MAPPTTDLPASARDRLLDAATQLFYDEGVHTVGVDRVVERAGVANATLYALFGNKDGLVRAYLMGRDEAIRALMTRRLARYATPRERLLGVLLLYDGAAIAAWMDHQPRAAHAARAVATALIDAALAEVRGPAPESRNT